MAHKQQSEIQKIDHEIKKIADPKKRVLDRHPWVFSLFAAFGTVSTVAKLEEVNSVQPESS